MWCKQFYPDRAHQSVHIAARFGTDDSLFILERNFLLSVADRFTKNVTHFFLVVISQMGNNLRICDPTITHFGYVDFGGKDILPRRGLVYSQFGQHFSTFPNDAINSGKIAVRWRVNKFALPVCDIYVTSPFTHLGNARKRFL